MNLIKKYNVATPRYTSYPTVPYWETNPSIEQWKSRVKESFLKTKCKDGISIYIHLPFCESLCTYCGCNTHITTNHSVENPYIVALLKEWEMYREIFEEIPRIREMHLGGGTPTFFSPGNLKQLIEGIAFTSIVCENPSFSFEAHPNNTTKEHLQTLYDLGFRRISLGIQDFDLRVQKIINRKQTFQDVERVTKQARSVGYTSINYDIIYGLPLQDLQKIAATMAKIKYLCPDRIAFYSYAHVPWIKPGQRSYSEKHLPSDDEKHRLYEIGRKYLENTGYVEIGMDHFALKTDSLFKAMKQKTLHRNFMGYTDVYSSLLIGLGVSSISDTWHTYAQNLKTVEQYFKAVKQNNIPIFKGHLLSQEDLILRKHILNIMCRGNTEWKDENMKCEAVYEALERLREMETDGLVVIYPYCMRVTKKGKTFMRNICMAFDARLWRNVPKTTIFSKVI